MTAFNIFLFDDFETLDAFGPVEIIGKIPNVYKLGYYSMHGGLVTSSQQGRIDTHPMSEMDTTGVLLIPGGMGTRQLAGDSDFIEMLRALSQKALYVLTVCTGSALLAKTGLLDGKRATGNKMAFKWTCSNGVDVIWVKKARWVNDGKFYTSSGVSAGMDMTLGFIRDVVGETPARAISKGIEYMWNDDADHDPFTIL